MNRSALRLLVPAVVAGLLALAAPAAAEPVTVTVGLHVLSVGDYDANRGTYTLDFYLILRWDAAAAPANFTPERFEFMNGRAASRELIFTGPGGGELWYRIQADLYAEPRFRDYPFDTQHLLLELEDAVHPSHELVYAPDPAAVGLDEDARVAGWEVQSQDAGVANKTYPFGEEYSRFRFDVELARPALGVGLRSFVPPVAFVVIAGIGFFLDPKKAANRLALATGMVISAVGFHVSQTVGLPSLPNLTLFDEVMVAVYIFLACCVGVSTLLAVNEDHWHRPELNRRIHRLGSAVSIALPVAVLALLRLV